MNQGFQSATESLKDLRIDNTNIMKVLSNIVDIIQDDVPTPLKIVAIGVIVGLIILQSVMNFWQNRTLQMQNGSLETVI